MARFRLLVCAVTLAVTGALAASQVAASDIAHSDAGASPPREPGEPVINGDDIRFPSYYDVLGNIGGAIKQAMARYPDVYSGLRFDQERLAIVVALFDAADKARVAQATSVLQAIPTSHGISIVTESAPYALAERAAQIDEIMANADEWSRRLGTPAVIANLNEDTGQIVIGVGVPVTAEMRAAAAEGAYVLEEWRVTPQSRRDDVSPWTAGNWLANTRSRPNWHPAVCTQGFTWRKWGVGGAFAGLAKHCVTLTGSLDWFHDQRDLGTLAYTDSRSDNALLAPAPGTFSTTVWVGGTNTDVERTVVGVQATPMVDTWVALSGANSGLNKYKIIDDRVDINGVGQLVWTDRITCEDGDSGGPWLTTLSSSPYNVIAHGQHFGELERPVTGTVGCAYQPVTYFSARMEASLVTG